MRELFYRLAVTGLVPRRWFAPALPDTAPPSPTGRPLRIEIVSHCWRYHHLLAYQLSSLVLFPPSRPSIRMTVFYSEEDEETTRWLRFFEAETPENVTWNWWPLATRELLRRSLGRNLAARASEADWVWFSDCDVLFRRGALDAAAAELSGREDVLAFPRVHQMTEMLEADHPLLTAGLGSPRLLDIVGDVGFDPDVRERAVGGFQILRGDVARALGYCGTIPYYQRPIQRWRRTHDDRVFRWLLGTHGTAIEVPEIYRIRHLSKGRKAGP